MSAAVFPFQREMFGIFHIVHNIIDEKGSSYMFCFYDKVCFFYNSLYLKIGVHEFSIYFSFDGRKTAAFTKDILNFSVYFWLYRHSCRDAILLFLLKWSLAHSCYFQRTRYSCRCRCPFYPWVAGCPARTRRRQTPYYWTTCLWVGVSWSLTVYESWFYIVKLRDVFISQP